MTVWNERRIKSGWMDVGKQKKDLKHQITKLRKHPKTRTVESKQVLFFLTGWVYMNPTCSNGNEMKCETLQNLI